MIMSFHSVSLIRVCSVLLPAIHQAQHWPPLIHCSPDTDQGMAIQVNVGQTERSGY